MSDPLDAIVVGAGFGGSTCAALLARRGLRVLLIDKNKRPGGKAMVVSREGFTYELWPVIHAPARESRCKEVLRELGLEDAVDLVEPRPRGAIYLDSEGTPRPFPRLEEPDPTAVFDVLGIRADEREDAVRLLADLTLMGSEAAAALDDVSFDAWMRRRPAPRPLRSYLNAICNGVFMVPTEQLAASEAIATLGEIFVQGGGLYCRSGGIGRLAEIFASAVEANGGRMRLGERVRSIQVRNGAVTGVSTARGEHRAPVVVSNAGIQPTVLRLVGEEHFDPAYVDRVRELAPSLGMIGIRYFLDRRLLDEPFYLVFSDEGHWTAERWRRADAGESPGDVILWVQVPSANDPSLAPPGRQCVLTGTWSSPDPDAPLDSHERWWRKIDRMVERVWPGFHDHVERRETYGTREVSRLSRDSALPGLGGECIGLGQVVGQCGRHKPSPVSPLAGLFYVGTDAGGRGCGTHQAVDSGIRVAEAVLRYVRSRSMELEPDPERPAVPGS